MISHKYLRENSLHALRFSLASATAVWLVAWSSNTLAATSCSFKSVSAVSFGSYNVFASFANHGGVGKLTISCQGGGNSNFEVTLSTGQSNSFVSRMMMNGANVLHYNLYTSTARSVIWGDGTGGSSVMTVPKNKTTTLSVFGQIPAGQDAAIGTYTDNIITTVTF